MIEEIVKLLKSADEATLERLYYFIKGFIQAKKESEKKRFLAEK